MSDRYVTLMGAEDVQRAGSNISGAADRMSSTASYHGEALAMANARFEETTARFCEACEQLSQACATLVPIMQQLGEQVRVAEEMRRAHRDRVWAGIRGMLPKRWRR